MTHLRPGAAAFRVSDLALISSVVLCFGCQVFDEALYQNAEGQRATLGLDSCPYPKERVVSRYDTPAVATLSLNGFADDIQDCGKLTGFDGPDAVVGIQLAAGERVHVGARIVSRPGEGAPPVDVGVYVMDSCDPATCLKRVNRCPPGGGEQIVFSGETQGVYYFGFDTKAYEKSVFDPEMELAVTFPSCGDRIVEPGETCDDGNQKSGDGCDAECHVELSDAGGVVPVEVEPNNFYKAGNVLDVGVGEAIRVKGHIGGGCDLDFFYVDVPEGGFARATLLGEDGEECPAGSPALALEFDDPSGSAELGKAKIPAHGEGTNHCPQWDETSFATHALPQGRYVIEMKPPNQGVGMEPFPYILAVEIIGPLQYDDTDGSIQTRVGG
ncbi:MAG: DUF4215 domain-containing protein [Nannocystaceae bacterium]